MSPSAGGGCDPEAGVWEDDKLHHYYGEWRCPLWNGTRLDHLDAHRFLCPPETPFRSFRQAQPACARLVRSTWGTLALNRSVFFVGDSLSMQHAKAFACRMLAELARHRSLPAPPGELWSAQAVAPWVHLANPRREPHSKHNARQQPFCVHVDRRAACFVSSWPTARATAERLVAHRLATAGDLVVLNDGLHMLVADALEAARATAASFANATAPLSLARADGVRFVWRETSPQAFGGLSNGSYRHGTYARGGDSSKCTAVAEPARPPTHAAAHAELEAAGLAVARTWRATVSQWDTHLANRTGYVRQRHIVDCTHFCAPSGVLEQWVDALLMAANGS